jgi:hypothetical protein
MNNLTLPTSELVSEACEQFDREDQTVEDALTELYGQYCLNITESHALLKVIALNCLYFTNIRSIAALREVANHICRNGDEIDAGLHEGLPTIVDKIARVTLNGKPYNFYSFATKFCSWHQPTLFPIWDSHVDEYLWSLKKNGVFSSQEFSHRSDLWDYPKFLQIMEAFRSRFSLEAFTFKQIDKFLYWYGAPQADAGLQAKVDTSEGVDLDELMFAETLDNPEANALADEMAHKQARTIGLSEEEIEGLIG